MGWTSIFNLGKLGPVLTLGGGILSSFFGIAANAAAAVPNATDADIATSFWSPLWSDPLTGDFNLVASGTNIVTGWWTLAKAGAGLASDYLLPGLGEYVVEPMLDTLTA